MPGRRKPPTPQLIEYSWLKAVAGGSGTFGGGGGFMAGQNMVCKVIAPEPGGYKVTVLEYGLPGYLPTQVKLKIGEEVTAQFVCFANYRALLTSRLVGSHFNDNEHGQNLQPSDAES